MKANGTIAFEAQSTPADHFVELISNHYSSITLRPHSARAKLGISGLLGCVADMRYDVSDSSGRFDIMPYDADNSVLFTLPEAGGMLVETAREQWMVGTSEAAATIGDEVRSYGFPGRRKHTNLHFKQEALRARLATIFEMPVREPLQFKAVISFDRFGPLACLLPALKNPDLTLLGNTAATSFSHFVQDMLLEIWPHNHSHLFERRLAAPSRPQVQAAINYIHDHAHEAPSTVLVAEASGVSLRTLQQAFREATGKTILEYSRDIRLQKAKEDILGNRDEPLADIARRWGFSNIGRFSRQFLEAFGELPSHIRRR